MHKVLKHTAHMRVAWECSLGHVYQKCLEDDTRVSQVVYHVDLVCWDRQTSGVCVCVCVCMHVCVVVVCMMGTSYYAEGP